MHSCAHTLQGAAKLRECRRAMSVILRVPLSHRRLLSFCLPESSAYNGRKVIAACVGERTKVIVTVIRLYYRARCRLYAQCCVVRRDAAGLCNDISAFRSGSTSTAGTAHAFSCIISNPSEMRIAKAVSHII